MRTPLWFTATGACERCDAEGHLWVPMKRRKGKRPARLCLICAAEVWP